jgi:cytoskeletal protein RodZ
MRQKIDITDVEVATKIRAKYLRALENEEWDLLPGPTFVRTFLRTYAQYLGLDAQLIVEEYRAQYEPRGESDLQQQFAPAPRRGREARPRRRPGRGIAVVAAVVALLSFLLILGLTGESGDDGKKNAASRKQRTTTAKKQTPSKKKAKPRVAAPTSVSLRIAPAEPTYVCIDRGGPPVLFTGTLDRPRTFKGKRLRLNLGRTSARVRVNGKRVPISGSDAVGFEFTPKGRKALPLGERPCA